MQCVGPVLGLNCEEVSTFLEEGLEDHHVDVVLCCEHQRGHSPFVGAVDVSTLSDQEMNVVCLCCGNGSGKKFFVEDFLLICHVNLD